MIFYNILQTRDIEVAINERSHFTIATSPYYAHQHALAIDIYDKLGLENYNVVSPIEGKIIEIKKLIAPKPRFDGGLTVDYLTLVRNPKNSRILYKLLHVKPDLKIEDSIEIGEIIGKTLRNGYFAPWSSPHLHLEIRSSDDSVRASGGMSFNLATQSNYKTNKGKIKNSQIQVKIESYYEEFALIRFPLEFYYNLGKFQGLLCLVNDQNCILDGGLPHYKHGIAISDNQINLKSGMKIFFGNLIIGHIEEINGQFGIFKFSPLNILFNGEQIRGISLFLSKHPPLMKIIPLKECKLKIRPQNYITFKR